MITLLDVLRGECTKDQLSLDAAYCHPLDIVTVEEVMALRRCKKSHVYWLREKGILKGPAGSPIVFYGSSVLALLSPATPPNKPQKSETPAQPPIQPPRRRRRRTVTKNRSFQFLTPPPTNAQPRCQSAS